MVDRTEVPLLNDSQQALVITIFNAIWREAMTGPLAGHNEGFLKVTAMRALLESGCRLSEGGAAGDKLLYLQNGKLIVKPFRRPRISARSGVRALWTSADLTVEQPVRLVVELQARSAASTQDALFSKNLHDDIERVRERRADAFFFFCDFHLWQRLRGERPSDARRLRRSKLSDYFASVLPDLWDENEEDSRYAFDRAVFAEAVVCRTPCGEHKVLMSVTHHDEVGGETKRD